MSTNPPPAYLIRQAVEADLPHVVALDQAAFAHLGTAEDPAIFTARLVTFASGFIVAEAGEEVIGYGTTEKWHKEREPVIGEDPYTSHVPTGTVLNITGLAIRQGWQNRGIGAAMLARIQAIARAEGCRSIILETSQAQRFYEQHDFTLVGDRVQAGVTLYILRKSLL